MIYRQYISTQCKPRWHLQITRDFPCLIANVECHHHVIGSRQKLAMCRLMMPSGRVWSMSGGRSGTIDGSWKINLKRNTLTAPTIKTAIDLWIRILQPLQDVIANPTATAPTFSVFAMATVSQPPQTPPSQPPPPPGTIVPQTSPQLVPSRQPLPLSASQEGQVREIYHKRVRNKCAEEVRRMSLVPHI